MSDFTKPSKEAMANMSLHSTHPDDSDSKSSSSTASQASGKTVNANTVSQETLQEIESKINTVLIYEEDDRLWSFASRGEDDSIQEQAAGMLLGDRERTAILELTDGKMVDYMRIFFLHNDPSRFRHDPNPNNSGKTLLSLVKQVDFSGSLTRHHEQASKLLQGLVKAKSSEPLKQVMVSGPCLQSSDFWDTFKASSSGSEFGSSINKIFQGTKIVVRAGDVKKGTIAPNALDTLKTASKDSTLHVTCRRSMLQELITGPSNYNLMDVTVKSGSTSATAEEREHLAKTLVRALLNDIDESTSNVRMKPLIIRNMLGSAATQEEYQELTEMMKMLGESFAGDGHCFSLGSDVKSVDGGFAVTGEAGEGGSLAVSLMKEGDTYVVI